MSSSSSFQRGDERRGRWGSPERTVVWTEPRTAPKPTRKVAVVYYLCRHDGHLDHPHFLEMELPLSSSSHRAAGLYLRDFTARLDALRGSGMPAMYAWSSKRSYRNGYVWQDLAEDDLVHPAHGADEYVLKGSPLLLLLPHHPARCDADASSPSSSSGRRRRNNWSSFDLGEHNNKLEAMRSAQNCAATTQTNHLHHLRPDELQESTELAIDEISPPPSSSSPDAGGEREVGVIAGGRMRASAMLMQLFSCGSIGAARRGHARGHSSSDLLTSAGGSSRQAGDKEADADASSAVGTDCSSGGGGIISAGVVNNVMDRDYFSGSLVESGSKTSGGGGDAALLLKRSSSCNADRGAAKILGAGGSEGAGGPRRVPRLPRKPRGKEKRNQIHGGRGQGRRRWRVHQGRCGWRARVFHEACILIRSQVAGRARHGVARSETVTPRDMDGRVDTESAEIVDLALDMAFCVATLATARTLYTTNLV